MSRENKDYRELAGMDEARLDRELNDTYRQLFTLRLQVATRQLQNVNQVSEVRRKIAQIKTLQRQRELVASGGGR